MSIRDIIWNWVEQNNTVTDTFAHLVFSAKESLHGISYTPDSWFKITQCIESPKHLQQFPLTIEATKNLDDARFSWFLKALMNCSTEVAKELPKNPEAYPTPLSERTLPQLQQEPSAALLVFKDNCAPCHLHHKSHKCMAEALAEKKVYVAEIQEVKRLLPPSVDDAIQGTPSILEARSGSYTLLTDEMEKMLLERCTTKEIS